MYRLFIDTHETTILALFKDLKNIDFIINDDKRQSTKIMPLIEELLTKNNLLPCNLSEILVVNGPGSFTGVRIGMTIAKTMAYTLNIPIKTITSLEMLAIFDDFNNSTYAVLDSKGGYVGKFENNNMTCEYLTKKDMNFENMVTCVSSNFSLFEKYYNRFKECNPKDANPIYIKKIEALK